MPSFLFKPVLPWIMVLIAASGLFAQKFRIDALKADLSAEVRSCEQAKQRSIAEAEKVARLATARAYTARLEQERVRADREQKARESADRAARMATLRADDAEITIQKLMEEAGGGADGMACLNADVPADLLKNFRN